MPALNHLIWFCQRCDHSGSFYQENADRCQLETVCGAKTASSGRWNTPAVINLLRSDLWQTRSAARGDLTQVASGAETEPQLWHVSQAMQWGRFHSRKAWKRSVSGFTDVFSLDCANMLFMDEETSPTFYFWGVYAFKNAFFIANPSIPTGFNI